MHAFLLQAGAVAFDPWAMAGRIAVVATLISSAGLLFFWRAILRALWCAGLSLSGPDLKAHTEHDWKPWLDGVDQAVIDVGVNTDRINYIDAAVKQQGIALMDSFTVAIRAQTESIQVIARASTEALLELKVAVKELRDETGETRSEVAEISGFLRSSNQWVGNSERRKSTRRKP